MLKTQKFLRDNNLDFSKLESEFGIKVNHHHSDGRVILNYNQIVSPKENPVVMECRALVLDANADLVARAFPRFFNWGEVTTRRGQFRWDDCWAEHKEDGSLVLIYHYQGKWRINTRNSFADENEWGEHIEKALPYDWRTLPTGYTYVFEFGSPFNQVVKYYPQPTLFLLSVFKGKEEFAPNLVQPIAKSLGLSTPKRVHLSSIDEAIAYIERESKDDQTFEGLVLRDCENRRWKIKSASYLRLHRLSNNGNLADRKNLIPIIVHGEVDEVLLYWPHLTPLVREIQQNLEKLLATLEGRAKIVEQSDDKTFALTVKDHPLAPLAFHARKRGVPIRSVLTEFEDYLVKAL